MAQAAGAPIETLESWFSAHNWLHERIGDEEIVASAKGAWNQYELRGLWREDDCVLQFLAFPDIKVTDAQAGHAAVPVADAHDGLRSTRGPDVRSARRECAT